MPNVAKVLKEEMARIAKKEAKAAVSPIRKPSVRARHDVADLKRRVAALEQACNQLQGAVAKLAATQPVPAPADAGKVRITARGARALRRKLRLSGLELAKLVGVTGQAVYNWDKTSGALRLRPTTRAAIMALRGIGAREARKRLEEMKEAAKAPAKRKVKRTAVRRRKAGRRK